MRKLSDCLYFVNFFSNRGNSEKGILSENLQDSPSSGMNEINANRENLVQIRDLLKNLPSCNLKNYGNKARYVFERDLTEEEKAFAGLYFEDRNLSGYGFRKNIKI